LFRSVPETERHAFLGAKKHAKNPLAADDFIEKLSEAGRFNEIRGNHGTWLRRSCLFLEEKNQPVYRAG